MEKNKNEVITLGRSCIDLYSQNVGSKFIDIKGFMAFPRPEF